MRARVWAGEKLLRALAATWNVEFVGEEMLAGARLRGSPGSVVFAFWHNALLVLAATHCRRDIQVLVSQHRDGEWIARILERLGYGLVRGSSRRGGVEALFRMAAELASGRDVAVTVDGPIGPRYRVQPGAVLAARRAGRPIVPVVIGYRSGWQLGTWDALRVPAPGTRVRVRYLEPLVVESDDPALRLAVQSELEARLQRATAEEEARAGRRLALEDVEDRRSTWEKWSAAERPPRLLVPLSHLYAAGVRLARSTRPRPAGAHGRPWVIGVGNLEAGGTGKTPCVVALAHALRATGRSVGVLTRGHGGRLGRDHPELYVPAADAAAADETRLLAAHAGDRVPLVVARDKRAGLAWLRRSCDVDVVLVDDAFQTAGLAVDRHLVLLDWERPLGNGYLLPAGRLREPPAALARAAAILFTRARETRPPHDPLWARLGLPLFVAQEELVALRTPAGESVDPASLAGHGVALLCGLGRPQAFEALVRGLASRYRIDVRRAVRVGDHAPIEAALRRLSSKLEGLGGARILISEKDFLRLPRRSEWDEPLLVVQQRLVIRDLGRLVACLLPAGAYSSA